MNEGKECLACGRYFELISSPKAIFCSIECSDKLEALGWGEDNSERNNFISLRNAVHALIHGNGPTHFLIKDVTQALDVIYNAKTDDDTNSLLNLLNVADAAKAVIDRMGWTMAGEPCPTCGKSDEDGCVPSCRLLALGSACAKLERNK